MELTTAQQFEMERMARAIDATDDPHVLRGLAKQLLQAWQGQKAATRWVMDQRLKTPSMLGSELVTSMGTPPWDDPLA